MQADAPRVLGAGCAVGCAGLMGLATLLIIASSTGLPGTLVGLVAALSPAPFYVALALWLDRFESEPPWLLFAAFAYGATAAAFFSLLSNSTATGVMGGLIGMEAASFLGASLVAPVVEEVAKGVGVLAIALWMHEEFDGVVDGFVYATIVALGFATTENVLYYGNATAEAGAGGLAVVVVLRGLMSPWSHPLYTSMTGIGLGLAQQSRSWVVKVAAPVGGLLPAIGFHALWNLTASIHGALWIATYVVIMLPAVGAVLGVVSFSLQRESKLIQRHLAPEVASGLLSPRDLASLASVSARMSDCGSALLRAGPSGWVGTRRRQQAASELAFLRERLEKGQIEPGRGRALEQGYLGILASPRLAGVLSSPSPDSRLQTPD